MWLLPCSATAECNSYGTYDHKEVSWQVHQSDIIKRRKIVHVWYNDSCSLCRPHFIIKEKVTVGPSWLASLMLNTVEEENSNYSPWIPLDKWDTSNL